MLNLRSVPVVDLVDVPKDNFVFSFHVIRDSLFLDRLHEALRTVIGLNNRFEQSCKKSSVSKMKN